MGSAKILHYCDGKHVMIKFNDDRYNKMEMNKQMLADHVKSKMIIRSNLKFPLWIHTHSPVWVLCSYFNVQYYNYGNRDVKLWRSAKILHYCDGKHVMMRLTLSA